jgi:hypothetical protein
MFQKGHYNSNITQNVMERLTLLQLTHPSYIYKRFAFLQLTTARLVSSLYNLCHGPRIEHSFQQVLYCCT